MNNIEKKEEFMKKIDNLSPLEKEYIKDLINEILELNRLDYSADAIIEILKLPINR